MSIDSASTERTDGASNKRTDSASTVRAGSACTVRADSTSTMRAFGSDIMVTSVKRDRDRAARFLRQTLRRLGSLTTEEQLQSAMVTTEQQYIEVFRLHSLYCLEKGEDQDSGAHMEWEDSVGDAYNEAYTAAEDKLDGLSQAKQPLEVTAKAKLERVKMAPGVMGVQIDLDVAPMTEFLKAGTLGSKEYEGLLAEKGKFDARDEESENGDNWQVTVAEVNAQVEQETWTDTEEIADQDIMKGSGHIHPGEDDEIYKEERDGQDSLQGYLEGCSEDQHALHGPHPVGLLGGVWLAQHNDRSEHDVVQQAAGWGGLGAHVRPPEKYAEFASSVWKNVTPPAGGGSELQDEQPDVVGGVLVVQGADKPDDGNGQEVPGSVVDGPEKMSAIRQGRYMLRECEYAVNKHTVTFSEPKDFSSPEEQFELNVMKRGVEYDESGEELVSRGKHKEMLSRPFVTVLNNEGNVETVKQGKVGEYKLAEQRGVQVLVSRAPPSVRKLSTGEQFEFNIVEKGKENHKTREMHRCKYKEMPSYPVMAIPSNGGDVEAVEQGKLGKDQLPEQKEVLGLGHQYGQAARKLARPICKTYIMCWDVLTRNTNIYEK